MKIPKSYYKLSHEINNDFLMILSTVELVEKMIKDKNYDAALVTINALKTLKPKIKNSLQSILDNFVNEEATGFGHLGD